MSYPAIGLINNLDPLDFSSEACAFLNYSAFRSGRFQRMNDFDRIAALQSLEKQQNIVGFSMAWPVFAPLCPAQNAFDSTVGEVYDWIKYNGLVGPINNEDYQISETSNEVVTPFRRNISTPNSPNASVKHGISFLVFSSLIFNTFTMELL